MSRSQRGPKVFMQSDCAACHSMLPYAGLREAAAQGDVVAQAAEITVVTAAAAAKEAQPVARPLHGGAAYVPGLATLVTDVSTNIIHHRHQLIFVFFHPLILAFLFFLVERSRMGCGATCTPPAARAQQRP
jgi:hypothetical protein